MLKGVLIILLSFTALALSAGEVRMATSEDIDLFDKAVEASSQIERSDFKSGLVKDKSKKNKAVRKGDLKNRPPFKGDASDSKNRPSTGKNTVEGRFDQLEERAHNKRRNKKRRKRP